jgi:hypothetical protein
LTKLQQLYHTRGARAPGSTTSLAGASREMPWPAGRRRHPGVASDPTIFAKAISGSRDYVGQFRALPEGGGTVSEAYWTMVVEDLRRAPDLLRRSTAAMRWRIDPVV